MCACARACMYVYARVCVCLYECVCLHNYTLHKHVDTLTLSHTHMHPLSLLYSRTLTRIHQHPPYIYTHARTHTHTRTTPQLVLWESWEGESVSGGLRHHVQVIRSDLVETFGAELVRLITAVAMDPCQSLTDLANQINPPFLSASQSRSRRVL